MSTRTERRRRDRLSTSSRQASQARWRSRGLLGLVLIGLASAVVVVVVVVVVIAQKPSATGPAPISSVNTDDVHSLAFLNGSERVALGHHGGILESNDGGLTWTAWGEGSDAMGMGVAGDEPIIVAGHDVLALGRPDGRWVDIANDLPNTDIHGFARDPLDPQRVWAYLAAGGLYESRDAGAHWAQVFGGHVIGLFAVAHAEVTRLVAVDPELGAIVASDDGGRTWQPIGSPPSTPIYAMAGANGGDTILYSGSDGLFRSDDGGKTFTRLLDIGQPILAVATTAQGDGIIVASRDRQIYRSDDGGRSWPSD